MRSMPLIVFSLLVVFVFFICWTPVYDGWWTNIAIANLVNGHQVESTAQPNYFEKALDGIQKTSRGGAQNANRLYIQGLANLWSLNQDLGVDILTSAAESGSRGAQYALGYHYIGVNRPILALRYLDDDVCASLRCTLDLSVFLYKAGKAELSLQVLRNYIEKHPGNASMHYHLATVYWGVGQRELSIVSLADAIRLDQSSNEYRRQYQRARLAYLERRYSDAALLLTSLVSEYPEDLSSVYLAGQVHLASRDYQAAEQAFQLALKIDEQYIGVHANLARAYVAQEKFVKAIDSYWQTLLLGSGTNNSPYLEELAATYRSAGQLCQAEAVDSMFIASGNGLLLDFPVLFSELEQECLDSR